MGTYTNILLYKDKKRSGKAVVRSDTSFNSGDGLAMV